MLKIIPVGMLNMALSGCLAIVPVGMLALALSGCLALTGQEAANLSNAAKVSCNAAMIAAAASVAITADIGSSDQTQKDAVKAQKITNDACGAIIKLPTVVATTPEAIVAPTATVVTTN